MGLPLLLRLRPLRRGFNRDVESVFEQDGSLLPWRPSLGDGEFAESRLRVWTKRNADRSHDATLRHDHGSRIRFEIPQGSRTGRPPDPPRPVSDEHVVPGGSYP